MRVAVLDDYHRVFDADPAIERLRERLPVDVYTERLTPARLRPYPILIALRERTRFDAAFFEDVPGLELISQTGNHAYHIDIAAATRAGVLVGMASSDLQEMGSIARSTIELAFGMRVLAWGPTLTAERAARSGATFMELDALLERADIVTVQLRLSEQSRGLLNAERLCRIGPRGVLINTARGAIVDEEALARVLAEGQLGAAGLDVFAEEPLPADSPLRRLDNVVLTPHLGWPADLTYTTMARAAVAIVEAYLDGQYARAVNPDALQHRGGH